MGLGFGQNGSQIRVLVWVFVVRDLGIRHFGWFLPKKWRRTGERKRERERRGGFGEVWVRGVVGFGRRKVEDELE